MREERSYAKKIIKKNKKYSILVPDSIQVVSKIFLKDAEGLFIINTPAPIRGFLFGFSAKLSSSQTFKDAYIMILGEEFSDTNLKIDLSLAEPGDRQVFFIEKSATYKPRSRMYDVEVNLPVKSSIEIEIMVAEFENKRRQ